MVDTECFQIDEFLQRDILNLMINDRDFLISSMRLIKSEYFSNYAHKCICEKIQNYFHHYNELITKELLKNEIEESFVNDKRLPVFLVEIDLVFERFDEAYKEKEWLSQKIFEFAKIRSMTKAIIESAEILNTTRDWSKIENLLRSPFLINRENDLGLDLFNDIDERYERIMTSLKGERFKTGFRSIDVELLGGLTRKEIGMVFSPPGVGKSLFLCNAAYINLVMQKNVLYLSCEMSEERIAQRIDAMITKLPINQIVEKLPELIKKYDVIKEVVNTKLKIKEFPAGHATIYDLRAYVNELYSHTGFKPDLIILDYIDELRSSNERLDTYDAQKLMTTEFRGWATMDNFCGLTATQANRIAKSVRIISDEHLGDCYGKVRVVDGMWSICQDDEEKIKNVARMFVVKHRNAPSRFMFYIHIDPSTLVMKEIQEEEYQIALGKK